MPCTRVVSTRLGSHHAMGYSRIWVQLHEEDIITRTDIIKPVGPIHLWLSSGAIGNHMVRHIGMQMTNKTLQNHWDYSCFVHEQIPRSTNEVMTTSLSHCDLMLDVMYMICWFLPWTSGNEVLCSLLKQLWVENLHMSKVLHMSCQRKAYLLMYSLYKLQNTSGTSCNISCGYIAWALLHEYTWCNIYYPYSLSSFL